MTMVTKITLGQKVTNEIMEKMHLDTIAAIGDRHVREPFKNVLAEFVC